MFEKLEESWEAGNVQEVQEIQEAQSSREELKVYVLTKAVTLLTALTNVDISLTISVQYRKTMNKI